QPARRQLRRPVGILVESGASELAGRAVTSLIEETLGGWRDQAYVQDPVDGSVAEAMIKAEILRPNKLKSRYAEDACAVSVSRPGRQQPRPVARFEPALSHRTGAWRSSRRKRARAQRPCNRHRFR